MAHRYIGRNIYELRKKRGWSQSDLARKLDKKASTISSYETDSKTPSVDTINCHVGAVRRVHRRADLWRERGSSFDKTLGGGAKARCCGLIAGVDAVQRRQRQGRACTDTIAFASHKGNGAVKKQASKFLSRAVRGCVRPCFFGQNSSFAAWNP